MTPALVAFALLVAVPVLPSWPAPATQRPVILLVHGRGQLGRDTASLRRELQRSLEAGLALPVIDSLFRDGDVRLVWYADALDPRSDAGCSFHESNPRSRQRWERRGGAQAFWDLARGVIGAAATGLESPTANETRGLLGDLLFAADLWKRCGAERRVADALRAAATERRPVILVSHSFGAIVTYGLLDGYRWDGKPDEVDIRHWVTVGSMLGVPAIRQLLLGDMGDALPRPAVVRRWSNVRDADDAFAARAAPDSAAVSSAEELETAVPGGALAHEFPSYLRDERTARSIVRAWCEAFQSRAAPAWCAALSR